jgi:hypothetical protein
MLRLMVRRCGVRRDPAVASPMLVVGRVLRGRGRSAGGRLRGTSSRRQMCRAGSLQSWNGDLGLMRAAMWNDLAGNSSGQACQ